MNTDKRMLPKEANDEKGKQAFERHPGFHEIVDPAYNMRMEFMLGFERGYWCRDNHKPPALKELPVWNVVSSKSDEHMPLNPIEQFILSQEPAGIESAQEFRSQLLNALNYMIGHESGHGK